MPCRRGRIRSWSRLAAVAGLIAGAAALPVATAPAHAAADDCTPTAPATNCVTYTASGSDQSFVVPPGVTSLQVTLAGSGGGNNTYGGVPKGGPGGLATGTVPVTGGQTISVMVGDTDGYGGGGAGGPGERATGGNGGGMTALWYGTPLTSEPLLIAGGGGGADGAGGPTPAGGSGGGTAGTDGNSLDGTGGGGGGTQTAGGAAGDATATAGAQYAGGIGGDAGTGAQTDGGGGGGGGFFGGGGGGAQPGPGPNNDAGGGGGSGFIGSTITAGALVVGAGSGPGVDGSARIEWTAPAPVITSPAGGPIGTGSPVVSGSAVAGNTVTLTIDGTTVCTTVALPDGTWSCPISPALADGDHTLVASQTDQPGNPLPRYPDSAPVTVTVDTVAPSAPVSSCRYDADGAVACTGAGEAGSTISVTDAGGATVCSATVLADGTWSCASTGAVGDLPLSIVQTNLVGNSSSATTPPTVGPTTCSENADGTVTCTGTSDPGNTITVTSPTGEPVCTATVKDNGSWSCTSTGPVGSTVTVTSTDAAGNRGVRSGITVAALPPTPTPTPTPTPAPTPAPAPQPTSSAVLADTGSDVPIAATIGLGALLMGLGAAALIVMRRRRRGA